MSTFTPTDWNRIAIEAMAIVVSILFAFWIDSTWDEHQALEEERVILSTLLVELASLQAIRGSSANYLPEIRESLRRLLEFGRDPQPKVSDEQIDAWLADASWNAARASWHKCGKSWGGRNRLS